MDKLTEQEIKLELIERLKEVIEALKKDDTSLNHYSIDLRRDFPRVNTENKLDFGISSVGHNYNINITVNDRDK